MKEGGEEKWEREWEGKPYKHSNIQARQIIAGCSGTFG
jgi:hypothetical protein